MELKFGIDNYVWVLFKVNSINVASDGTVYYNLKEETEYRKGLTLMNKREEELVPAFFKEEYDIGSGIYRATVARVVEAEEKKGKWINREISDGVELIMCSNCKRVISKNISDHSGWRIVATVNPKYCPWCGAKMEVEDEDSN